MISYKLEFNSFYTPQGLYMLPGDAAKAYRANQPLSQVARAALDRIVNETIYDAAMWSKAFNALKKNLAPEPLEPHQEKGIYHLLTRKRSYLAHAPGAGKSLQAVAAHWIRRATTDPDRPTSIIICPPSLVANWRREILKWTPRVRTALGHPPGAVTVSPVGINPNSRLPYFDSRADFIICPDSILHSASRQLAQVRSNITAVDEASRFKTPTTRRSQALYLSGLIQNARHFVMLDGSPMTLGAVDLWAPLFFLDPESIGFRGFNDYCDYFTVTEETRFGIKYSGSKNLPQLRKQFFARLGHGVSEKELDHPLRLREIVHIGSPSFEIEEFGERGLRELGSMPSLDETGNDSLAQYRRMVGREKIPDAIQFIEKQVAEKRKVLAICYHREVCERIAEAFKATPLYGGVSGPVREYELDQFKRGKSSVLVGGIGPMGRGHNIQEGDVIVFVEWSWSDEENKQAEKRVSRMGNKRLVTPCVYLALKDSVDERILTAVLRKQGDFDAVFG